MMHFCARQPNMSQAACCQFVLLLNDTKKVPFCDFEFMERTNSTELSIITKKNFTKAGYIHGPYTTPVYLTFPSDVPEDHVTFLFGILLLASIAISCTFIILKLTKPKFASMQPGISYTNAPIEYDWMMFMPYQQRQRRSSTMLFLRGMMCRSGSSSTRRSRRTSFSLISRSNSSMTTILPSYRSATASTISPSASIPPPPYEELQTLTSSTHSACHDVESGRRDNNNNRRSNRVR